VKERLVICNDEDTDGRARVARDDDEEHVLYSLCVNRLSGSYLQM